jgi:hypothetical protein
LAVSGEEPVAECFLEDEVGHGVGTQSDGSLPWGQAGVLGRAGHGGQAKALGVFAELGEEGGGDAGDGADPAHALGSFTAVAFEEAGRPLIGP